MNLHSRPLCIDMFCGLGGWADGFLAEGYDVVGFDLERHDYGTGGYPGQLVIQDALTLHGKQFKDAAVIVASPPCQEYSYMAMPWSRAKAIAAEYRTGVRDRKYLTALFDACFRIQREACEAAGHHIPLIVENVRGAEPWLGRAKWHYGSFYLWGDVPALMPPKAAPTLTGRSLNAGPGKWKAANGLGFEPFDSGGVKVTGFRFDGSGRSFQSAAVEGVKQSGISHGSKSPKRNAASAAIAKIPLPLARHIAKVFKESM